MKQSKTSRYSYLAGLVDGEGTIAIKKRDGRDGKSPQYELFLQVVQKDGVVIDWLYGVFGGMVRRNKCTNPSGELTHIYEWRTQNNKAYELVKHILPFLIVKKEQAQVALQFGNRIRVACGRDEDGRRTRLSEYELSERERLKQKLHELKKIFRESAVVETKREDSSREGKL